MVYIRRKGDGIPEPGRFKNRIIRSAFGALLILAIFLLFTAALNSYVQGSFRIATYPDSPRYDSVPIAFTVSFDPQRVKRVTGDTYRVTLPVKYSIAPHQATNTDVESFTPYFVSLPLLVASPKSFRQSCLLVDIPPPSL